MLLDNADDEPVVDIDVTMLLIGEAELIKAVKRQKIDKSPGFDWIMNEYIYSEHCRFVIALFIYFL